MQTLEQLTQDAQRLAAGEWIPSDAENEAARQLQICNACRYCEGFCAVFPAMTRRLTFKAADLHYMANLCHHCGACLHACQYAPPHDFGVNIPQTMARVRGQTYADFAWPAPLGKLYQRNGLVLSLALAAALVLFLGLGAQAARGGGADNFYGVFPHTLLVSLFAPIFLWAVLALGMGVRRFWLEITPATSGAAVSAPAAQEATRDVLRLRYLDGGHGDGCNNADDEFTHARRRAHHLTFYGFLLCFAATALATLYHYVLGLPAPYPWPSAPKLLGVAGGVGLLLGTAGLFKLHLQRHPLQGDAAQKPMDLGFMALLFWISGTGLALWLSRGHASMPSWLVLHLAAVMALLLTLPYNKFAHGIFRTASLIRFAVEKRQPNPIGLGSD